MFSFSARFSLLASLLLALTQLPGPKLIVRRSQAIALVFKLFPALLLRIHKRSGVHLKRLECRPDRRSSLLPLRLLRSPFDPIHQRLYLRFSNRPAHSPVLGVHDGEVVDGEVVEAGLEVIRGGCQGDGVHVVGPGEQADRQHEGGVRRSCVEFAVDAP